MLYNACKDPDALTTLVDYAGSLLKFLGRVMSQSIPWVTFFALWIINKILEKEDLSNWTNF